MSLKVFDLHCDQAHVFEGWFASAQAYQDQHDRGLLSCPMCGSTQVARKVSAARLNVSNLRAQKRPAAGTAQAGAAQPSDSTQVVNAGTPEQQARLQQIQAQVLQQLRSMVRATENVGERFAQEARLMHQGQAPERAIRGVATAQQREELADEGIAVVPIPDFLDDDRMQ